MQRFYTSRDMAKLYCAKCNGCGDCCHAMTDTIHLDPYDTTALSRGLGKSFDELLEDGRIGLHEEEGLSLPHLAMQEGGDGACTFLGPDGRCTIHGFRPGFCRLFPLGRDYDAATRTFRYFIVDSGCDMPGRYKVRIDKWIGIPDLRQYEQFVSDWHYFVRAVKRGIANMDPEGRQNISAFLRKQFYETPFPEGADFYPAFEERLSAVEKTGF